MTTYAERIELFKMIYTKYRRKMWIHSGAEPGEYYSLIESRQVVIPGKAFIEPRDWDIFALLHEIGHVLTNKKRMKRCQMEYEATVWAIKEAHRIGFDIPPAYRKTYQDYIWSWLDAGIKVRGSKGMPTRESLTLHWD